MSAARVVVMTKAPVPGRVKTRLIPALGAHGACRLHRALVEEAMDRVTATGLPASIALAGDEDGSFASDLRGRGWRVEAQSEGDLGERMLHALRGPGRALAIGTDIPLFEPEWLVRGASSEADLVIGPAEDGGYWTIGLAEPTDLLFRDMPWSTERVFETTIARARQAGMTIERLPTTYDMDDPSDLDRLRVDPLCPPRLRRLLASL